MFELVATVVCAIAVGEERSLSSVSRHSSVVELQIFAVSSSDAVTTEAPSAEEADPLVSSVFVHGPAGVGVATGPPRDGTTYLVHQ